MSYHSPLSPWLDGGKFYLKSLFHITGEDHVIVRSWVVFDHVVALHESPKLKLISGASRDDPAHDLRSVHAVPSRRRECR
jgi:hypothetical protein